MNSFWGAFNMDNKVRKRTNIDQRKAIRRYCEIPTDFSVKNRACVGVITNISPFGAFIIALDIFQIGDIVRMVIIYKAIVKPTGIIKWIGQNGFGLQFTQEQPLPQGIGSKFADAYNDRGLIYGKKSEYDVAISYFSKAIEINPKLSKAYNNRGIAYYFNGQYDQAISDFSRAIEINPRDALAYANRGEAYFSKKEYDKAWNDVSKAQVLGYKIDPKFLEMLR